MIGRFIIRFGAGFGTVRYVNPLYDIVKGDLSEALRIHTDDVPKGQGISRLRPVASDLGVVTIVGNFGDPTFNNEERPEQRVSLAGSTEAVIQHGTIQL